MRSLVYVSSACKQLSDSDLMAILQAARVNNARAGISGMLLYHEGNIIQALEGPDQELQAIYEKITRDPRHKDVFILLDEPIEARQFASWSMGFHKLSEVPLEALDSYSDFLKNPVTAKAFTQNHLPAYELLMMFRENLQR